MKERGSSVSGMFNAEIHNCPSPFSICIYSYSKPPCWLINSKRDSETDGTFVVPLNVHKCGWVNGAFMDEGRNVVGTN